MIWMKGNGVHSRINNSADYSMNWFTVRDMLKVK